MLAKANLEEIILRLITMFLTVFTLVGFSLQVSAGECPTLLKFAKRKLNAQEVVNLCAAYQGKTLLIVNTASYCGFTKQFKGLEALYAKYKEKGLVVLGFPSHDFNQEDKDEAETAKVCQLTYGVKFPMFESLAVRGDDADPLFRLLAKQSGTTPKWNFYKYLVDKQGKVVDSYSSMTAPDDDDLIEDIEKALGK